MTVPAKAELLTVSHFARVAGASPDTLRYYEREGLLKSIERSRSGYRLYAASALDRVRFIQGAQRLGLRLREIRQLLDVRDGGACPCSDAAELLTERLHELDAEIQRLSQLRADVHSMVSDLPSPECVGPAPGQWRPPATT